MNSSLRFGLSLPQGWTTDLAGFDDSQAACEAMMQVARTADALGFASVWLVDHLHTVPHATHEPLFECWTTTAALARETSRIRIGQLATCNVYRSPALLAKMAGTVDVLSGGRLTLGIGAGGANESEYRAYGYDFPPTAQRLEQLREAVQVILALRAEGEATFEGRHYRLQGAINAPRGVQQPHIPLLIAGSGEQVTLKLVAEYADACNVVGDLATVRRKFAALRRHCESVGRDYDSVHRTVTAYCSIARTDDEAVAKLPAGMVGLLTRLNVMTLVGAPATIRTQLQVLEAAGAQEVIVSFPDALERDSLTHFAREFIG